MELTTIWLILFYVLLIDSIGANIVSWFGFRKWYRANFRLASRYFPATKGWTGFYLAFVLFVGYLLHSFVVPLF